VPGPVTFGVYIHWPFCAAKCPYCDFNSHVRAGGWDEARLLAAYEREIMTTAAAIGARATTSVFFGGGTPSLMQPDTVARILAAVDRRWPIAADAEITLEANPSSVQAERFRGYRAAGVNRVSLGVQSLVPADLKALGRLHTVDEARAAIEIARSTFDRVSFDLIYARPGQTLAAWQDELGAALELAGAHLSLYQLTIEPETPYAALHRAGKLRVPSDDLAREFYLLTEAMTAAARLPAYEVSNYARPGEQSRHNLLYWRYGEYAGIGPGAHGRVMRAGARIATVTERVPEAWCRKVETRGDGVVDEITIGVDEARDEALIMGLRLVEGLDLTRFGDLSERALGVIGQLSALGLVTTKAPGRVAATAEGRLVLNEIVYRLSEVIAPAIARVPSPPASAPR
jgi:oxygen-independent coproporphyrinogen-3 oxidase